MLLMTLEHWGQSALDHNGLTFSLHGPKTKISFSDVFTLVITEGISIVCGILILEKQGTICV